MGAMAQLTSQTLTQRVCIGSQAYALDLPAGIAGSTYTWTLSGGGAIVSGNGTYSITVNWTTAGGPYTLTGVRNDGNCDSPPQSVAVTVIPLPTPNVTGPTPVCLNSTGNVYTTPASGNNFNWVVSANGSITAGGTASDNTVTVTWNSGVTGTVAVTENVGGASGCSVTNTLNVTVNTLPVPTITGPTPICAATTTNVYTTEAGMTGYAWTVSAGGTITAGGTPTSNTVTVTWNTAGAQTVSVNYTNGSCIAAAATVFNVTINALPTTSPIWHN